MIRVSPLRLKAGFVLVLAMVLAPFVANFLIGDIKLGVGTALLPGPGTGALLMLALINLVLPLAKPSLLRRIISGSWRDALLVPAAIGIAGTTVWLALLYFFSDLASLNRLFATVHVVVLSALLVLGRFAVRQPFLGKAAALLVAAVIAYIGTGGGLPYIDAVQQSYIIGLFSSAAAFGSQYVEWFRSWSQSSVPAAALPEIPVSLVSVVCLVLAAIAGSWVQRRYFRGAQTYSDRFRAMVVWVLVTHFVWLATLFATGLLPLVPRWVPVATAVAMVLVASARFLAPLLAAISRPRDVLVAIVDPSARSEDPQAGAIIVPPSAMIPNTNGRIAWIISMTGVSGEPRVLRQAEALTANGWRVVVCGFDGKSPRPKNWHFIRMPTRTPFSSNDQNTAIRLHNLATRLVQIGGGNPAFAWAAHWAHSTNLLWYHIRKELVRVAREHPELQADLVIAHDYHTADMGYDIARLYGAKYSIDIHEYAREQYSNDPEWVKKERPVIIAVQDYYLRRADLVTVVCAGISELLAKESRLKRDPVTIRNVPFKQPQSFRPTGSRIRVLYHGDLSRHRYIHDIVKSMPSWRANIDLVLRGSGDPAYIADLKRSIAASGLESRVLFEPPVPFDQIVPAANGADIGLFSYEAYSPQIRLALPNKLFEYIMAGLAVCITKLDEAGRVVQQYGVGKLIPEHSPASIAETINSFTNEEIDAFKQASIRAAEELNWDAEKEKLIAAYQSLYSAG